MPTLSVIIPTWQEAPLITDAVQCAQRIGDEVIVVDGCSEDGTAMLAEAAGARVIQAPKGCGRQLQACANAATGDILLFLHADVRLPPAARTAILQALSAPDVIGGNFLIRFLPASWFTRLLAWASDIRRHLTRRYYGDSGIFVRHAIYFELGGYKDFPLMEDYDFSTRIERFGRCAYIRQVSAYASAPRFQGREQRVLLLWRLLHVLYWLGVPPHPHRPSLSGRARQPPGSVHARLPTAVRQQFKRSISMNTPIVPHLTKGNTSCLHARSSSLST